MLKRRRYNDNRKRKVDDAELSEGESQFNGIDLPTLLTLLYNFIDSTEPPRKTLRNNNNRRIIEEEPSIEEEELVNNTNQEWRVYESDEEMQDIGMIVNEGRLDLPLPIEDQGQDFVIQDESKSRVIDWFLDPNLNVGHSFEPRLVELLRQMFPIQTEEPHYEGVLHDGRRYDTEAYTLSIPDHFTEGGTDDAESYWTHSDPTNLLSLYLFKYSDATGSISRQDMAWIEKLEGYEFDPAETFLVLMPYWRVLYNWIVENDYFINGTRTLHLQVVFKTEVEGRLYFSTKAFRIFAEERDEGRRLTMFSLLSQILNKIRLMDNAYWEQYKQAFGQTFAIKQVLVNAVFSKRTDDVLIRAGCQGLELGAGGTRLLHNDLKKRVNFIYDPPSVSNNCVFACIMKFNPDNQAVKHALTLDEENSCIKGPAFLREFCEIGHTDALTIDDIRRVSRKLLIGFQIYGYKTVINKKFSCMLTLQETIGVEYREKVPLLIVANHAWLLIPTKERKSTNVGFQLLKYRKCATCSKWFVFSETEPTHFDNCTKCVKCGSNFQAQNGHSCSEKKVEDTYKGMKIVKKRKPDDKETYNKNVYFADYETFTDALGTCFVYAACVVKLGEDNVRKFYGNNSATDFATYISTLKGTLVFYNGSNFDNLFLLTSLLKIGAKITKVIKKGSQLMQIETPSLKVWDLCLFTKCSLANACKSYKVPEYLWKTSFNHKKVTDHDTAEQHREEVEKYCAQDVLALRAVYSAFASKMWELFSINVTDCITLSQFAFEYWRTTLEDQKIVLPPIEDYEFIRRGLYGGRCGPQYTHFNSDEYISLMRDYHKTGKIEQHRIDELNDCLRFFDVVSLYPSRMKYEEYPLGVYSHLTNDECATLMRDVNNCDSDWIGFAEVDIQCPNDLITPFLMSRGEKSTLVQDLTPKWNQVYPSSELYEAVRLGYRITRIHKAISFETKGNPFEKFIDKIFALKAAAAVEPKDPVQYEIAKLMMNSLSGKMSQRVVEEEWKILQPDALEKETEDKEVVLTEHLTDELGSLLGYACLIQKDEVKVTKPLQLGCFILSWARVLMSRYLSNLGCSIVAPKGGYQLKSHSYYYTDTDALVLEHDAVERTKEGPFGSMFGSNLGDLEDELKGGKIIRASFLAPKSYCIEYVKDGKVYTKVRCKGVPHTKEQLVVQPFCNGPISLRVARAEYHLIDPQGNPEPSPFVPEEPYIRNFLDCDAFHLVQFSGYKVFARFDKFNKKYFSKAPSSIADISINKANRHLSKDLWWTKRKRAVIDQESGFSVPIGHKDYPIAEEDHNTSPDGEEQFFEVE